MKLFSLLLLAVFATLSSAFVATPAAHGAVVARAAVAPAALPVEMTSANKKAKAATRKMKSYRR